MTAGPEDLSGDQARVSVSVSVAPDVAFRVFTEEIDHWWIRGLKYRLAGREPGVIQLEPGVGGRLLETYAREGEPCVLESGRVTTWEPPRRLVLDWRAVNFDPSEKTQVEVTFSPTATGTLVTVTHRGWSRIRADHPVRHGQEVPAFLRMMAMWWGDLATALREYATTRSGLAADSDQARRG